MGDSMVTFEDIIAAKERIEPYIIHTPLLRAPELDELVGCKVYLKLENFQITGSFKLRGATNFLVKLCEGGKVKGVVCASSGNHAKGVAYISNKLGIEALIVMPTNCNITKLEGVKMLGGTVIFEGTKSSQRNAKAKELQTQGYTLVHSHADPNVIAGQGTIGIEIIEDLSDVDKIVVPLGGGGLISGISIAVKKNNPRVSIIGVEPSGAPRYRKSRDAGKAETINDVNTIADGTRCDKANPENFQVIESLVDDLVNIDDESIREAMRILVKYARILAEPSSSLGIAAGISGKLPITKEDKVCFVITGGNNDINQLCSIINL